MGNFWKEFGLDLLFVITISLVVWSFFGLLVGFEDVSLVWAFIGACLGKAIAIAARSRTE